MGEAGRKVEAGMFSRDIAALRRLKKRLALDAELLPDDWHDRLLPHVESLIRALESRGSTMPGGDN